MKVGLTYRAAHSGDSDLPDTSGLLADSNRAGVIRDDRVRQPVVPEAANRRPARLPPRSPTIDIQSGAWLAPRMVDLNTAHSPERTAGSNRARGLPRVPGLAAGLLGAAPGRPHGFFLELLFASPQLQHLTGA